MKQNAEPILFKGYNYDSLQILHDELNYGI